MTTIVDRFTLKESIEALADYDFDCAHEFRTALYLNPEDKVIETFRRTGNTMPSYAYHRRWLSICAVDSNVNPVSVVSELLGVLSRLESALDAYQGAIWNGSDHIGNWGWDEYELGRFDELMSEMVFSHFWEPSEWFEPCLGELKAAWLEGETAEQIIDSQNLGDSQNGECDRQQAIDWLEGEITEWEFNL